MTSGDTEGQESRQKDTGPEGDRKLTAFLVVIKGIKMLLTVNV